MIRLSEDGILYHGSYMAVISIDLSMCRSGLDFGKGFYLTSSIKRHVLTSQLPSEKPNEQD